MSRGPPSSVGTLTTTADPEGEPTTTSLSVTVRNFNGTTMDMFVEPEESVESIKTRLQEFVLPGTMRPATSSLGEKSWKERQRLKKVMSEEMMLLHVRTLRFDDKRLDREEKEPLEDESMSMEDYGIEDGACFFLVLRERGYSLETPRRQAAEEEEDEEGEGGSRSRKKVPLIKDNHDFPIIWRGEMKKFETMRAAGEW